jgi:hypothetical protein
MHSFSTIFVFLLALLPHVLSLPVPDWSSTVVKKPAVDDAASKARVTAYNEADARAKEMVTKMHTVINSDKPEHKQIVNDAFGPKADRGKIKEVIRKLNTEQVKVGTTDIVDLPAGMVASTPRRKSDRRAGNIKLGHDFFAADTSKDLRAGTLIHEATHQQSHTGDLININDKIVGALADQTTDIKMQENGIPHFGYHFPGRDNPRKVPTSAADLSDKYKANRDHTVKNMEDNADSYRVFAHLCSAPGVARRDLELFRRALFEADEDDHLYLAKRNSCALPKDYFKKKAEAKAAAAKKTTGAEAHSTTAHGHAVSAKTGRKTGSTASHLKLGSARRVSSARGASRKGLSRTSAHASRKSAAGGHVSHPAKGAAAPRQAVLQKKTSKK